MTPRAGGLLLSQEWGGRQQECWEFSLDFLVTDVEGGKLSFTGLQPTLVFHPTNGRIFRKHLKERESSNYT